MKQNKETLKQFFETGDKPTQEQYSNLIDSYIDAKQPEGEANRRFVIDKTGEVSVASEQQVPTYKAGANITLDNSDYLNPVISANISGLEFVSQSPGRRGWRLIGRDETKDGQVGYLSVDFSYSTFFEYSKGASGMYSFTTGQDVTALGNNSFSTGISNFSKSFAETSVGHYGTSYEGNGSLIVPIDRLFNVGNGIDTSNRNDAFTILKRGDVGIGIDNFEANTTGEKLQVNGVIKAEKINFTGLPTYADDASAGTGGLITGDCYKTSTGELRIKL
ncbi:hypothetical protein [Tenacibaculum sp. Ill]|uniref:hypothetical protein n=1 Tax=Tenacibaculum sp. Ill TaxID=3445935 RepID=UPI003F79E577